MKLTKTVMIATAVFSLNLIATPALAWKGDMPERCLLEKVESERSGNKVESERSGNKVESERSGNKVESERSGNKVEGERSGNKVEGERTGNKSTCERPFFDFLWF